MFSGWRTAAIIHELEDEITVGNDEVMKWNNNWSNVLQSLLEEHQVSFQKKWQTFLFDKTIIGKLWFDTFHRVDDSKNEYCLTDKNFLRILEANLIAWKSWICGKRSWKICGNYKRLSSSFSSKAKAGIQISTGKKRKYVGFRIEFMWMNDWLIEYDTSGLYPFMEIDLTGVLVRPQCHQQTCFYLNIFPECI